VEELAAQIGGTPFRCDATDEKQVEAFVEAAVAKTGRIDLAVAAVGRGALGSIEDTGADKLEESFHVNFFGPYHLTRFAARHMTEGGSVTLFSSITSEHVMPGSVAYSCAKAAINTFAKYAAIEYAPRGIRINALKVGVLEGPQAGRWRKAGVFDTFLREVPLGRPVDSRELAQMIIWLALDAKSITGETIFVDGGGHLRRQTFPDEIPKDGLESMGRRKPAAGDAQKS
jgi:NAD(P)-dependent dehydrogenase (short-subunit alcohol dehydrogenase family)